MDLKKLSRALAIAGWVALQAACGSSGTTGTSGSSGGGSGTSGQGASTGSTGTTGGGSASGTASGGSTTGGGPISCNFDSDCQCGEVCSWANTPHHCVAASTGDPGWCDSTPNCLYEGQTCSGTSCTPAWTAASVCSRN